MNRPNHLGETPLHCSTKAGAAARECTRVLLKAGAIPRPNSKEPKELPEIGEHLYDEEIISKLKEAKELKLLKNHRLIALQKQAKAFAQTVQFKSDSKHDSIKESLQDLLTPVGEGEYMAKQNFTLWSYTNEGGAAVISKHEFVQVSSPSKQIHLQKSVQNILAFQ